MSEVKVGQVWVDNDARSEGRRTVLVTEVDETHATVLTVTDWYGKVPAKDRKTRIRLDRFKPTATGYRLAGEDGAR